MSRSKNGNSHLGFDDIIELVDQLKKFTKNIKGYKFPAHISEGLRDAAELHVKGEEKEAVEQSLYRIRGAYFQISSYFRNSHKHFEPILNELTQQQYPLHILEGLRSKLNRLQEACRIESGSKSPADFSQRLTAYDQAFDAFNTEGIKAEYERYKANQKRKQECAEAARKAQEADKQREIADQQRQAAIAKRTAQAEELKKILAANSS